MITGYSLLFGTARTRTSYEEAGIASTSDILSRRQRAQPFLKWPGGKRWAAKEICALITPHLRGRYIEPFLGGGAVFFALQPRHAILGDINPELMETYATVCARAHSVVAVLRRLTLGKRAYYRIRAWAPGSAAAKAARFLYLNRTAFAGLYRLNRRGDFNVPYAGGDRTPAPLWRDLLLTRAATALTHAEFYQADFEDLLDFASDGDVAYCDPTYTVAHNNNGFVRYNERNFSWADQIRLARSADRAVKRGATVLVSNACHRDLRSLYPTATVRILRRTSRISPDTQARRPVSEYLFLLSPTRSPSPR